MPLSGSNPQSHSLATAPSPANVSPPLDPANLNQAPTTIPTSPTAIVTSSVVAPNPADPATKVPSVTPTVAETGVPKVAGPDGPGPSSGSLLDNKPSPPKLPNPFDDHPPKFESAEEEKHRLEREERERLLHGEGGSLSSTSHYESAEEEKKRLEREEREKVLRGEAASNQGPPKDHDAELPPYQEF